VGKTFPNVAAAPRVFIEGNYASGTKNPAGLVIGRRMALPADASVACRYQIVVAFENDRERTRNETSK
jgi:hypothetical protein